MAAPSSRLPPLNGLRAFEVAARHLSFTRAAEELQVTPAAVGQQVRTLERFLGVDLFERLHRDLRLTEAGRNCLPELQAGFRKLGDAMERVRETRGAGTVVVTVDPAFAASWLVRRLRGFHASHPDVEMRLDATQRLVNLERETVDIAIRYGAGRWPGLRAVRLVEDEVLAVCSPSLVAGPRPLREPADLVEQTLLHEGKDDEQDHGGWRNWLLAAGVDGVDPEPGPRFSRPGALLDAAAMGKGVALARRSVAAEGLHTGRLVCPFARRGRRTPAFTHYLVWKEHRREHPPTLAFRRWLLDEAAAWHGPAGNAQ